jgi:ACT domain-containing protein
MKALTKASRINHAIQVMQHMNSGMTVVDACKEIGIPRSTYYHLVKTHPEAMAEYQEMVEANARMQLGLILSSKTQILEKVVEDAMSEETSPRDRLAIYKTLSELGEGISQTSRKQDQIEAAAQEFLKRGANTARQKSRFIASRETVTIESET